MSLDFGIIQDYDCERGFGFVSRTVWASISRQKRIFCHIKKIKRKYSDLARRLDDDKFFDVGFWYDTEITSKGEQVSELWLTEEELPASQRAELIAHIESLWRNIEARTPSWLDKLTLKLVCQAHRDQLHQEREKLKLEAEKARLEAEEKRQREEIERRETEERRKREYARLRELQKEAEERRKREEVHRQAQLRAASEQVRLEAEKRRKAEAEQAAQQKSEQEKAYIAQKQRRKNEIQQVCHQKKITNCVHFTHIQNLRGILQNGLLSRSFLEAKAWKIQPQYNDLYRLDGYKEAICLSISFPNYRMFYKYSKQNKAEWVVLLLNASLLWDLDCAFCQENAAANPVTRISLAEKKQSVSFQRMFESYAQIKREDLSIPTYYPTHPQAEVLVFDQIPLHYINAVHFLTLEVAQNWLTHNKDICERTFENFFFYGNDYFNPRQDWQSWKN
jgi:chemotaxis protein histidine kinase CheA